jgi:clan AA aspartic protease
MEGVIAANLDILVPLTLRNDSLNELEIEAVLDRGFNDYLTLPPDVVAHLNLTAFDTVQVALADGTRIFCRLYLVRVIWHGQEKIITAQEADGSPLIGMQLLLDSIVTIPVRYGETVTVAPFPT